MNSALDSVRIAAFQQAITDYSASLLRLLEEKKLSSDEFTAKHGIIPILSSQTEKYAIIFKDLPFEMITESFVARVLVPLSADPENSDFDMAVKNLAQKPKGFLPPPVTFDSKWLELERMLVASFTKADGRYSDYEAFRPTLQAIREALKNSDIDLNTEFCYFLFPQYIRDVPEFHLDLLKHLYGLSALRGYHQARTFQITEMKKKFERNFEDLKQFIHKSFYIINHEGDYDHFYFKFNISSLTFEQVHTFVGYYAHFLERGELDKVPLVEHIPHYIRGLSNFDSQLCIKLLALIR